jgi:hypothetical protein
MNVGRRDYAERRAARIARLEARAARLQRESAQAFGAARRIGDAIPFGQPILVGHHSEGRHRRDAAKIERNMRKGVAAAAEAERLERRVASAESNDAISSDDPEALTKLRAKLAKLESDRETMKRANVAIRKAQRSAKAGGTDAARAIVLALGKELGWSEATATKLATPDFAGRIGFADYELTNRSAEARRLKDRIALLEAAAARSGREEQIGDVRVCEADNRVQMHFPGKPDDKTRAALKGAGFRWAPSTGAWQRLATDAAWDAARRLARSAGSSTS